MTHGVKKDWSGIGHNKRKIQSKASISAFKLAYNVVIQRVGDFLDGLNLDNIKQKTVYLLGVSGVIQPASSERKVR